MISNLDKTLNSDPVTIKEGQKALVNYIDTNLHMRKDLKLNEEIHYGGDDICGFIFEKLEKAGDKTIVEVSFHTGPL